MKVIKLSMKARRFIIASSIIIVVFVIFRLFLSFIYVPPILMYHLLDENEDITKLSLSPAGFERQMDFLYRHNYNVISLEKMAALIKRKNRIPPKTVAITLDDGYKNNYLHAYPTLKKYGFPAIIFVITDFIGKEGYLSWNDIDEMKKNNIDIGSHTKSHAWLPDQDDEKLKKEIFESKNILEKRLEKEIKFVSYPWGAYDERVKSLVKEAGFKAACATNTGPHKRWDDIYALKRIRISRTSNNLFNFWLKSSGYYTFIEEMRDEH